MANNLKYDDPSDYRFGRVQTWEKKMMEEIHAPHFFTPLIMDDAPKTRLQRLKLALTWHLWRRWEGLRFGFYWKQDQEDRD